MGAVLPLDYLNVLSASSQMITPLKIITQVFLYKRIMDSSFYYSESDAELAQMTRFQGRVYLGHTHSL